MLTAAAETKTRKIRRSFAPFYSLLQCPSPTCEPRSDPRPTRDKSEIYASPHGVIWGLLSRAWCCWVLPLLNTGDFKVRAVASLKVGACIPGECAPAGTTGHFKNPTESLHVPPALHAACLNSARPTRRAAAAGRHCAPHL